MISSTGARVVRYLVLVGLAALFLLPLYLLVRGATGTSAEVATGAWLPRVPAWDSFREIFSDESRPLARALANSAIIAVLQTVGVVAISLPAGYAFARIRVRYGDAVFGVVLATLLVPAAITFVPTFLMVSSLGWVSSLRGLVVPGLFQATAVFLFRQHFLGFPRELEEAALLDGAGPARTFARVALPGAGPVTAAVATITFVGSWNAFLWPLVIGQDPQSWTVQLVLSSYITAQTVNVPAMFAAAAVSIAPLLVFFLVAQRWIAAGVERTGISG
ncbi:Binding-protein-dependent transport systems inner membrane component OS=Tsukamurella paurometabola(strain ATCC 8368 / DSM / CCUG 35730 / CIP 100753 / JCM 10117 / KCTC 9821 / NBRC 16120 / NCIMB 702349 / NCTC 13040)OX=521096 GN=Tpau_1271 PE=3 SV=1 [Tsukamurella paurometabola]|uniref:Binding-protein-dependent transport systems inner membrane component n=1 Tax=Tsukamurella paurometabola (strain ATCC 8368 / DSM 20162 / CCUG 35730 / CIP 100753 / JCM 10117 / KCTC 9821 / NBRC 16120 / NCIMB 702349 / NCTC 13040) TaxID=521096 RepID=D5UWN0_TSUPD|nr:carbohydrate ABC transporter permease [Tsukamurella paurometabola]ADG77902.1 binding-protein-dependent transport systems inner membrane component [Tsukamurella paurometabola DSM 20162]SUP29273.1 Maltose transport system permease protein malG [Tsukamurella paurometabola]